ncbi:MAG: TlpA family protein disulfide reductase [Candidatus Omnitrophica bacterium]|nr:TlpA family protein disulfide reductase [Candidatus Omnitrophota bacterium]
MMRPKDPRDLIGKAAPDFSAAMLDGSQFKLADHKGKNIVIIDFWATWCGPCVYGLPVLNEVANAYKDKGVVFIAVNQGDSPETIKQFQEKKSLVLPVGLDQAASIGSRYYVGGIPQTVLVDKEGKVATVHVGLPVDLKGMLSQELDTLLAGGTLPNEPVQPPKPPQPAEGATNGGAQESAPPR